MRVQIAAWTIYDWQGPSSNVKFRITADSSFLARENDNSGVEVDSHPKVFREVDCTVGSAVVDGLTVKTITIPTLWLYSTNDAIVGKTQARYSAKFVTKAGQEIQTLDLLQSFQLIKELLSVFNPVPWHEIIRANNPAAPVPMNMETFSTEQILDLIGGGSIIKGTSNSGELSYWSGPVTLSGAVGTKFQNADSQLHVVQQNSAWNVFRILESDALTNVKPGGSPALFTTHVINAAGLSHRALANDAATRRWTEKILDSALGLQYSAYDNSDVLQSNTIFDPAGGIGFSDSSAEFGYFYKASSAYHFGIAASVGTSGASKEITFTASGVGINKPTAIGAQLHVVSGNAARNPIIVDSASSPSTPIALFRNNASARFSFNHDAVATFGLASTVKGKLTFAVQNNANTQTIEGADTPASNISYKLPAADPANGQILSVSGFSGGVATLTWSSPGGTGDVVGPASATDNAITRFDSTTGKLIQNSAVTVDDTTGAFGVPNTWFLKDANGNELLTISVAGSAVNNFNVSNVATGASPVLSVVGNDTNISQTFSPKGTGLNIFTRPLLLNVGTGSIDNLLYTLSGSAGAVDAAIGFFAAGFGSGTATDGPYFLARGNNFSAFASDQKGSMFFVAGNITSPTGNQGKIRFMTGNEVERFNIDAAGQSNFFGNIFIQKDSPSITLNDSVSGSGTDFQINFNGGATNIGRSGQSDLQLANATGVYTFGSIPVLPGSNPTTASQAARKQYVDDTSVGISVTLATDQDPNTAPGFTESGRFSWFAPDGTGMLITKIKIKFQEGSHTSGGTLTYFFRTRTSGGTSSDIGSINLDNTNNTIHNTYTVDIGDITLSPGDSVTIYRQQSGTITERSVSVGFIGTQKRI